MQSTSFVLMLLLTSAMAQGTPPSANEAESPKQLVERYWKLETSGERLTTQGWNKLEAFRIHPSPPPQRKVIVVVSPEFSVWDPIVNGSRATVNVDLKSIIGEISPEMRFTRHSTDAIKEGILFKLEHTSKYWELSSDGKALREITGPPQWRIDEPSGKIWLNVDTAIHYVTEIRNKTNDPEIKRNAVQTITRLGAWPTSPAHK